MNEYGKLQIQLKQLKILEKRMMKQLDELRQEESNLLHEIHRFNNLDALRSEYGLKYDELSTSVEEIKDKKRVTENVVRDSERRNQTIKVSGGLKDAWQLSINKILSQESLRNNETYRQISHMEEKLNDLVKDNKLLQRIVDELNQVKLCNMLEVLSSLKI